MAFNFNIGGFNISPTTFAQNNALASVQMPQFISPSSQLTNNQFAFVTGVFASNKLTVGLSSNSDLINFNGGYLGGKDSFQFKPNYTNPALSVGYITKFLNFPSDQMALLLEEADKKKGDKVWIKNFLAFIGKNWTYIVSGVVTAATLIQQSKQANFSTNLGVGLDGTTAANGTGFPSEIIIPTNSGGTGTIESLISSNLLPIGLGAVALYFILKK